MNLLVLGIAAFMLLFMLRGYRIGLFKSAAGAIGIGSILNCTFVSGC